MNDKLKKIDEIDNLFEIGFHFSDNDEKIESIKENGLRALIGDNSSIFEATPKVSFSLGIEGVIQTFNRFLNLSQTIPISFFQNSTHKKYLPESIKEKNLHYIMTTRESFEFLMNYFENSSYFIFDTKQTKYDREPNEEDIKRTNKLVKTLTVVPVINDSGDAIYIHYDENSKKYNIKVIGKENSQPEVNLLEQIPKIQNAIRIYKSIGKDNLNPEQIKEYELLVNSKNNLIITLMDKTKQELGRGEVRSEGLFDKVAFHEQKLKWRDQSQALLNVQSRVRVKDGKAVGVSIPPEELCLFSVDGIKRATVIDAMKILYEQYKLIGQPGKSSTIGDMDLIDTFLKYIETVKNNNGRANFDISKYPELKIDMDKAQEFANTCIGEQRKEEESIHIDSKPKSEQEIY